MNLISRLNPARSSLAGRCSALLLCFGLGLPACKGKAQAETQAAPVEPLKVSVEGVTEIEVPRYLRLTGTLRGNQETDLAANAAGRVLATSIERGQTINKGDVLARLDTRALALSAAEAAAQVKNVEAQESQARVECARYESLKAKGAVTDLEYQQKLTQCQTLPLSREAASARARLAAQNVGDGVIRAPFAGVITERFAEVGQYLRQDSRVASIVAVDPMRLELAVPEAEVGKVAEGAAVRFKVSAFPERSFEAKIRFVSGALRTTTRDLIVEALVDNHDKLLRPGMFADAELAVGVRKVPSVPKSAVLQKDETARAFIVVGGQAQERVISLGPSLGERVAVEKGLKLTDNVIVSDVSQVANGQPVH